MSRRRERRVVFTVGHSNRPIEAFLRILAAHGVQMVVDVRRFPHSPRQPVYEGEALAKRLARGGIGYVHLEALGGRRSLDPGSTRNAGWEHRNFRGYADWLSTDAFARAFAVLTALAGERRVAILCAEALWWRCHRRLLADALVVSGFDVWHLMGERRASRHARTPFLRVRGGRLSYPSGKRAAARSPARRRDRPGSQPSL